MKTMQTVNIVVWHKHNWKKSKGKLGPIWTCSYCKIWTANLTEDDKNIVCDEGYKTTSIKLNILHPK